MGGDITDLTGKVVECSSTAIRLNIEKVGGEWPLDPTQWSRCSTGGQDQSEVNTGLLILLQRFIFIIS
ncbi:hypothetical protein RRG08_013241 [Elysia crispata]|uniref:Uncharacterized protein n=1 Tax=Elysia crispata TaxID=231223 RepID=A0AAE0Z589_9GAST|nr:hypothetical protein RRG08_013241 [Elysia crispata]